MISIDRNGDWRLYTNEQHHLSNSDTEMLGTVTCHDGITRGLLFSKSLKRFYAAGNKELLELDQDKIKDLI